MAAAFGGGSRRALSTKTSVTPATEKDSPKAPKNLRDSYSTCESIQRTFCSGASFVFFFCGDRRGGVGGGVGGGRTQAVSVRREVLAFQNSVTGFMLFSTFRSLFLSCFGSGCRHDFHVKWFVV